MSAAEEVDDDWDRAQGGAATDETLALRIPQSVRLGGPPPQTFYEQMLADLENGELPALNILYDSVVQGFNFETSVKALVPMAFGTVDADAWPDTAALARTVRELEAVVGVLIEARALSPTISRHNQVSIKKAFREALNSHGVIFRMMVRRRLVWAIGSEVR